MTMWKNFCSAYFTIPFIRVSTLIPTLHLTLLYLHYIHILFFYTTSIIIISHLQPPSVYLFYINKLSLFLQYIQHLCFSITTNIFNSPLHPTSPFLHCIQELISSHHLFIHYIPKFYFFTTPNIISPPVHDFYTG